jgi:hypothetical protein
MSRSMGIFSMSGKRRRWHLRSLKINRPIKPEKDKCAHKRFKTVIKGAVYACRNCGMVRDTLTNEQKKTIIEEGTL